MLVESALLWVHEMLVTACFLELGEGPWHHEHLVTSQGCGLNMWWHECARDCWRFGHGYWALG